MGGILFFGKGASCSAGCPRICLLSENDAVTVDLLDWQMMLCVRQKRGVCGVSEIFFFIVKFVLSGLPPVLSVRGMFFLNCRNKSFRVSGPQLLYRCFGCGGQGVFTYARQLFAYLREGRGGARRATAGRRVDCGPAVRS